MILILVAALISSVFCSLMTEQLQKQIVAVHNDMRSKCARGILQGRDEKIGPAAFMWHMRWNVNFARLAQAYTDTFPTAHNLKHVADNLSDNYYYASSPKKLDAGKTVMEALKIWQNRVTKNSWDGNVLTQSHLAKNMADAVRMLWGSNAGVGCGLSARSRAGKQNELFFVCFYGQPMDVGKEIFKKGPTCSACTGTRKCDKSIGLCKGNWR
ncbi:unnamed protein product [Caenorhabditis angaria]|uniref:SCP domain-containing protein n=1 Tax=Caenorhabditis angaria TaxID=860376 RepID=A0A9P1IAB3_9PELO|nr:unnamed protein product [Caenorhabditis angaria]